MREVWRSDGDAASSVRLALEPKPNEPRANMYLATVGEVLYLISRLDVGHRDLFGVNPETAHSRIAGLDYLWEVELCLEAGKLFHIHLNSQDGQRFDQDLPFGYTEPLKDLALLVVLQDAGYEGIVAFDIKAAALAAATLFVSPYLYMYDVVVLGVAVAFLMRYAFERGFTASEIMGLVAASALILIYPEVKTQTGLAAVLIVLAMIVQRVVADAQPIHHAGPEAFHQHVGFACERMQHRAACFSLQIEARDALAGERRGLVGGRWEIIESEAR